MGSNFDNMQMAPIPAGADAGDTVVERNEPPRRRAMAASELRGYRVRNRKGEDLGKIEEIVIDVPTGRVAYAALAFGGILGIGARLFAVPWQALRLHRREAELILNVDKSVLESAPGFDPEYWPNVADPAFLTRLYGYYGYQSYADEDDSGK